MPKLKTYKSNGIKYKHIQVYDNTFRTCVEIVWDCKITDIPTIFWDEFEELCKWNAIARYMTIDAGRSNIIRVSDINDIPVLSHELLHLVFQLAVAKGITYSEEWEERYTYMFEFYLRSVMDRIKQFKWFYTPLIKKVR